MSGLVAKKKYWGGSYECPSCGLLRKRRKYPASATCRWCRWKKQDDATGPVGDLTRLPERIAFKISVAQDGCWHWISTKNGRGYGVIGKGGRNGGMALAHRVVYEALVGSVPSGWHLHHRDSCVKSCVNPAHLTPLSREDHGRLHSDNNMAWRERMKIRTHCSRGHELTMENIYLHPRGSRLCRTCRRNGSLARRRLV